MRRNNSDSHILCCFPQAALNLFVAHNQSAPFMRQIKSHSFRSNALWGGVRRALRHALVMWWTSINLSAPTSLHPILIFTYIGDSCCRTTHRGLLRTAPSHICHLGMVVSGTGVYNSSSFVRCGLHMRVTSFSRVKEPAHIELLYE